MPGLQAEKSHLGIGRERPLGVAVQDPKGFLSQLVCND